jgi:hypothetical protein
VALAGEVGEFANISKKIRRGDLTLDEARMALASELADIFIYTLKLSGQLGVDLEAEFFAKLRYNRVRFERFLLNPRACGLDAARITIRSDQARSPPWQAARPLR